MQVFYHHIYELKKGIRDMVLCTLSSGLEDKVRTRLEKNGISYMIQKLANDKINVFFGKEECIVVARKICRGRLLNQLSAEEDFMLGILLGYSVGEQCRRYCKKQKETILSL